MAKSSSIKWKTNKIRRENTKIREKERDEDKNTKIRWEKGSKYQNYLEKHQDKGKNIGIRKKKKTKTRWKATKMRKKNTRMRKNTGIMQKK